MCISVCVEEGDRDRERDRERERERERDTEKVFNIRENISTVQIKFEHEAIMPSFSLSIKLRCVSSPCSNLGWRNQCRTD